jgi:uncharacterized phage protein gp47/JayE
MADLPQSSELFQIAVLEACSHGSDIQPATCETDGTDVNALLHADEAVGSECVYQLALLARDRLLSTAQGDALDELIWAFYGLTRSAGGCSSTEVTLARTTAVAGSIPAGTLVAAGTVQFATLSNVNFQTTDSSQVVSVLAVVAGSNGNVLPGTINQFVDGPPNWDLTFTVTNPLVAAGGTDGETDAQFLSRTQNLWLVSQKGTLAAVIYGAGTTPGAANVSGTETDLIPAWDALPAARFITICVADPNGNSSPAMIAAVQDVLQGYRACGCYVLVAGGVQELVSLTLHYDYVAGYDAYATDQRVVQIVLNFVNSLPVGGVLRMGALAQAVANDPGVVSRSVAIFPSTDVVPTATQTVRTDLSHMILNP